MMLGMVRANHAETDMIVISGAQIGVDRAGLDAAISAEQVDSEFMGWCPAGRRARDGVIPAKYIMREHASAAYPPRTKQNIRDADATLVLGDGGPSGGTALTLRYCRELGKPYTFLDLPSRSAHAEQNIARWVFDSGVAVLNIAGPGRDELYKPARVFVRDMLQEYELLLTKHDT
jgi:hypothetical protein